jgi:hypothetical protein
MSTPDKPRRWLRFSLRSLFLLVLVIGVSLAWTIYKAREQGIAVAALKEMGWLVEYDNSPRPPTVLERMRKLLGEDESRSVTMVNGRWSEITDAGLAHLEGLTQLQSLYLNETQVTDAGLVHLRGLSQLAAFLSLSDTQVSDAGLVHLGGLTQLIYLILDGTQVTDAGLAHLRGLTRLKVLTLDATQVTDAGVQRLKRALPNCDINLQ